MNTDMTDEAQVSEDEARASYNFCKRVQSSLCGEYSPGDARTLVEEIRLALSSSSLIIEYLDLPDNTGLEYLITAAESHQADRIRKLKAFREGHSVWIDKFVKELRRVVGLGFVTLASLETSEEELKQLLELHRINQFRKMLQELGNPTDGIVAYLAGAFGDGNVTLGKVMFEEAGINQQDWEDFLAARAKLNVSLKTL